MIMIIGIIHDHCNRTVSNMMAGGISRRDEKNSLLLMQMGQVWYMTDTHAHAHAHEAAKEWPILEGQVLTWSGSPPDFLWNLWVLTRPGSPTNSMKSVGESDKY